MFQGSTKRNVCWEIPEIKEVSVTLKIKGFTEEDRGIQIINSRNQ